MPKCESRTGNLVSWLATHDSLAIATRIVVSRGARLCGQADSRRHQLAHKATAESLRQALASTLCGIPPLPRGSLRLKGWHS